MEEQCKELRVSVENSVGKIDEQTKRSPVKVSRQKCEVSKNVEVKCKELSDSVDGSRIQIARKRSEWSKNLAEQTKELSVSADGIKNSPSKIRRTRSELIRELSVSVDGMEKSPVRSMRTRDMSQKESKGLGAEIDRSSVQLRKVKSASSKASSVGNESNAALTKTRSEASKDSNVPGNSSEGVSSELSQNPQKLQHRSAFIFGLGTFVIMSSSYTTDLNISVISVVSYVGLIYLAITFNNSGVTEEDETNQEYVFGVEEAIWLLKMILPYVNELLLKARALFSGDPATTMKGYCVINETNGTIQVHRLKSDQEQLSVTEPKLRFCIFIFRLSIGGLI